MFKDFVCKNLINLTFENKKIWKDLIESMETEQEIIFDSLFTQYDQLITNYEKLIIEINEIQVK
jgi:hypothetical protein